MSSLGTVQIQRTAATDINTANVTGGVAYVAPSNFFYWPQSTSGNSVVKVLSTTYMNGGSVSVYDYIELQMTFTLLGAVLDSAPTAGNGSTPSSTLFVIYVKVAAASGATDNYGVDPETANYIVDADVQTISDSASSPTYITQATSPNANSNSSYWIAFPVTNFFSVARPGAPYRMRIRILRQTG